MAELEKLAEQAKGMGFYVYGRDDDNSLGWKVLGHKGFRDTTNGWIISDDGSRAGIEQLHGLFSYSSLRQAFIRDYTLGANEVVLFGDRFKDKEKKRWFGLAESDYITFPARTRDVIVNGTDEPASELLYISRVAKLDSAQRTGVYIGHGLVASKDLIERSVEAIRREPGNTGMIFQGAFPELEGKHRIMHNGKIFIAEKGSIDDKNLGKFVIEY